MLSISNVSHVRQYFARQLQPIRFGNEQVATTSSPKAVPVKESRVQLSFPIFPKDTNELGYATAGTILKLIDIAASFPAKDFSKSKCVTASLDRLKFINPVKAWEVVSIDAQVTKAWNTSMEVGVKVRSKDYLTGKQKDVAQAYLIFVAMDEQLKPTKVPSAIYETEAEKKLAELAEKRKQNRLSEKGMTAEKEMTRIAKSDKPVILIKIPTEDDANILHNVFGGVILEQIHLAGQKAARQQADGPVIGLLQDRMMFEQPARIGEKLTSRAIVTRTWDTSMEIQVDIAAKDKDTGKEKYIASSYMVFVGLDSNGKTKTLPKFVPETPRQKQRWKEADIRRQVRLKEESEEMTSPPKLLSKG